MRRHHCQSGFGKGHPAPGRPRVGVQQPRKGEHRAPRHAGAGRGGGGAHRHHARHLQHLRQSPGQPQAERRGAAARHASRRHSGGHHTGCRAHARPRRRLPRQPWRRRHQPRARQGVRLGSAPAAVHRHQQRISIHARRHPGRSGGGLGGKRHGRGARGGRAAALPGGGNQRQSVGHGPDRRRGVRRSLRCLARRVGHEQGSHGHCHPARGGTNRLHGAGGQPAAVGFVPVRRHGH